jgi:hypothetical protein
VILLALGITTPAPSYLSEVTASGGNVSPNRWDFTAFPVQWNLNPSTGSNITGSRSATAVINSAFATWGAAPNALLAVARGADSTVTNESKSSPGINLICFICADADFTRDTETLAVTISTTADAAGEADGHGGSSRFPGQIIKADIIFNPSVSYSTDPTVAGGNTQDLQTVATHEIGHFFGLDHTGVVRAVMFPFAPDLQTTLSYDDVAGISTVYPNPAQSYSPGSIAGRVSMAGSGAGVFGAHVFAGSTTAALPIGGNIRKSPIGTLTRPDGTYLIQGVPGDSYILIAEPLDQPMTSQDVQGYVNAFHGTPPTNFTSRWH